MQTNKTLNKAIAEKNDEFYTPLEIAKKLIDPFIPQLQGKRIICPCDSEWSNIYIYIYQIVRVKCGKSNDIPNYKVE